MDNSADDEPKKIEGTTFVCEVPKELGAVAKLEVKRGRVVARTESGQSMIVPVVPKIATRQT